MESLINAVDVASKIARAVGSQALSQHLKKLSRLVELIWFIQWRSFQDGGIDGLVDDLIQDLPDRFILEGIPASSDEKARLTLEDCCAAWNGIWTANQRFWGGFRRQMPSAGDFLTWLDRHSGGDLTAAAVRKAKGAEQAKLMYGVEHYNSQFLRSFFSDSARRLLPDYLVALCTDVNMWNFDPGLPGHGLNLRSPIYCRDIITTLCDYMDIWSKRTAANIAETPIQQTVFTEMEYACEENRIIKITGNSRFGKTESVKIWCLMRPGLVRYVRTPSSNSLDDVKNGCIKALGGDVPKRALADVLQTGRLGWVFDEAHFLYPVNYTKNTVPGRLNWVREHVFESNCACVLVATPQSYAHHREKFIKCTNYAFQQFDGRINLHVSLPDCLRREALENVARFRFPEVSGPILKIIIGAALRSESYITAINDIAVRARFLAKSNGQDSLTWPVVKLAIEQVVPSALDLTAETETPAVDEFQHDISEESPKESVADEIKSFCPGKLEINHSTDTTNLNEPSESLMA